MKESLSEMCPPKEALFKFFGTLKIIHPIFTNGVNGYIFFSSINRIIILYLKKVKIRAGKQKNQQ